VHSGGGEGVSSINIPCLTGFSWRRRREEFIAGTEEEITREEVKSHISNFPSPEGVVQDRQKRGGGGGVRLGFKQTPE